MIWNHTNVYFEEPTLSQCVFIENNVKNNRLTFIVQHNIQLKSAVFSEKHFRNIYQVWHGFLFLVLFVSLDYCSAFENSCCNCFTGFLLFFLFLQNCIIANNNWNCKHLKNSSWLFFLFFKGAAVGGWCANMLASQPAWPPSTQMWSWVRAPMCLCPSWRSGQWKNTQRPDPLMPMVSSTSREGLTHTEPRWGANPLCCLMFTFFFFFLI